MASPITHFLVGAALALPLAPQRTAMAAAGLIAVAPDFDMPVMDLFYGGGGDFFGHRGIFHAPLFLILAASLLAWLVARRRRWIALAVFWSAAAVSHPLLDAFSDAEPGVMLLFPFTQARLFFSWRPIRSTPADVDLFLQSAGSILRSELPFILAAVVLGAAARKIMGYCFAGKIYKC